jgi:hypothetical protein
MDYIPVPLGYWSCAFQAPGSNASLSAGGYSLSSLAQGVGSLASDMSKFGGQLRCPTCRCMQSSLMEMSTGNLNSDFPSYGLCYRTNCAMPDYLQIGVRGQYDGVAYWYACPAAGGKLYIPGYFGALTCPVAKDFCRLETITGVRYTEQSIYYEWIFWAAVCGFAFLVYLSCALHCLRERCIRFWKYVCGVRVFDPPGHRDEHGPAHLPPDSPKHAHALLIISWLTFACGAGIAGTAAYIMKTTLVFTGTVQLLGVGVLLLHISVFGLCGARAKPEIAPSCWLISYFVMNTGHLLLTLYVVIYQFQFQSWTETVRVAGAAGSARRAGAGRDPLPPTLALIPSPSPLPPAPLLLPRRSPPTTSPWSLPATTCPLAATPRWRRTLSWPPPRSRATLCPLRAWPLPC